MDEKIAKAKEEAASRKGIIEKVDRWMLASDEERWLEEYDQVSSNPTLYQNQLHFHLCVLLLTLSSITLTLSQDENRYSVSRNAHRNLRRAERARIAVSKITGHINHKQHKDTNMHLDS